MFETIRVPSFVVDTEKVGRNARRMVERARRNHVVLRPHLKTHQSARIASIFRDLGVDSGTVSSLTMARQFAEAGWQDLTIAFPVNPREMAGLDELAGRVRLGLLVDNFDVVDALIAGLHNAADVWIKIDSGSRRCGLAPDALEDVTRLAERVRAAPGLGAGGSPLRLAGLLTHDSRTYAARGAEAVGALYREATSALLGLRDELGRRGFPGLRVSVGDTPSASLVEDWMGVDEARPGNFAYYDLQQIGTGACSPEDVAAAVACPVVGIYPERSEAVVYGGAVHLSKQSQPAITDFLPEGPPETSFGAVWRMDGQRWTGLLKGAWIRALTQEHGIVRMEKADLSRIRIGDLLFVCPVHSCLAAHALREDTVYI